MNGKPRILIVEDDKKLADLTREFLETKGGLDVSLELNGRAAVGRILEENYDLVVLDIMLPDLDGLSVCKEVRPKYPGPILMLTALGDEVDEIVGLEVGADDYLPKPASPRLLLARVKALLRRCEQRVVSCDGSMAGSLNGEKRVEVHPLIIDASTRVVKLEGEELALSTAEFDLLWYLVRNRGRISSREEIYRDVRGIEWDGLDRSVDQRIKRLRQKLGDNAQDPHWIKSVRGTGYLFAIPS